MLNLNKRQFFINTSLSAFNFHYINKTDLQYSPFDKEIIYEKDFW